MTLNCCLLKIRFEPNVFRKTDALKLDFDCFIVYFIVFKTHWMSSQKTEIIFLVGGEGLSLQPFILYHRHSFIPLSTLTRNQPTHPPTHHSQKQSHKGLLSGVAMEDSQEDRKRWYTLVTDPCLYFDRNVGIPLSSNTTLLKSSLIWPKFNLIKTPYGFSSHQ